VDKETILEFAGLPTTCRYDKYLGLPSLVGRFQMKAFKNIMERVQKWLQDWKLRFLSQVGKEILLKAMVQAIPSFFMSVFLLLKSLCLEINNLMKGFWWWHIKKDRKIPWMSWDKLGIPKNSGGMGFRDLNCFNKSLLAKQVWRMWTMPDSLVAQIMKAKYFPNCSILEAPLRTRPSFAWRGIRSSCALIREGLIWRIGNRNKIKIWEDRWLPKPTSFRIQTPPTMLDLKSTVNQLIDVEGYY
jgi:hypothetical protein